MRRTATLTILALGSVLSGSAYADGNCQPITIQGWKPEWNHANCAEAVTTVDSLGEKAGDDDPHCGSSGEFATATQVKDAVDKAATDGGALAGAKIGAAVGGPVGVVVGGVVGAVAGDGFKKILKNNQHVDFAKCTDVCLHLPVKATNIIVQGWSGPMPNGHDGDSLCDMFDASHPGRCDWARKGNWTAMSQPSNDKSDTTGYVYCSTAKNWSEDTKATLWLRATYDLTP